MSESICRFISAEQDIGGIRTTTFVYETEYKKFHQPFLEPIFKLAIVTAGEAILRTAILERKLERGTLFFGIPGNPYYLDGGDDFHYILITFAGTGSALLMERAGVGIENLVFPDMPELCTLFESSVKNSGATNTALLSKGLLYYALAMVAPPDNIKAREPETLFTSVVEYVDANYTNPNLTLGSVADAFSYTEKYLSSLFKRHMKIGFNAYLTNLRIQKARELLPLHIGSVAQVSAMCGFESPLYFSKVFKKRTGLTPSQHIKTAKKLEGCGKKQ